MSEDLRNFDLSVEEIKLIRMMTDLSNGLEKVHFNDPGSPRTEFFREQIEKLEMKLEQIRENTLIR